jgi:hypothetical protein
MVIGVAVFARLERYAARRGDSGYRVRRFARCCGVFLGAGLLVALAGPWQWALLLFAIGAGTTTFFLLWFRRPRVGPARRR